MPLKSRRPATPEGELKKLEALCARSEQCSHELALKLKRKGFGSSDIGQIMSSLIQNRYVDDNRFARAFANDKMRFTGWGRVKIALALRQKHIDAETIADALDQIDPDEYFGILTRIIISKARTLGDDIHTYNGAMKLFRQLVSRGYEPQLVSRAIRLRPWEQSDDCGD